MRTVASVGLGVAGLLLALAADAAFITGSQNFDSNGNFVTVGLNTDTGTVDYLDFTPNMGDDVVSVGNGEGILATLFDTDESTTRSIRDVVLADVPIGNTDSPLTAFMAIDNFVFDLYSMAYFLFPSDNPFSVTIYGIGLIRDVAGAFDPSFGELVLTSQRTPGMTTWDTSWSLTATGSNAGIPNLPDVPIPATALLLPLGLAGLAWSRRRRG